MTAWGEFWWWMPIVVSPACLARSGQSASVRSSGTRTTPRVRNTGGPASPAMAGEDTSRVEEAARPRVPQRNVRRFMGVPRRLRLYPGRSHVEAGDPTVLAHRPPRPHARRSDGMEPRVAESRPGLAPVPRQVRPRRPDRHQGRPLRPGQVGDGGAVAAGSRALRRPPGPAAVRGEGGDPIPPAPAPCSRRRRRPRAPRPGTPARRCPRSGVPARTGVSWAVQVRPRSVERKTAPAPPVPNQALRPPGRPGRCRWRRTPPRRAAPRASPRAAIRLQVSPPSSVVRITNRPSTGSPRARPCSASQKARASRKPCGSRLTCRSARSSRRRSSCRSGSAPPRRWTGHTPSARRTPRCPGSRAPRRRGRPSAPGLAAVDGAEDGAARPARPGDPLVHHAQPTQPGRRAGGLRNPPGRSG